jgi:putative NADH-flavin reductase
MKVVIFGASGKIGRRLVAEMLVRGHLVRAFVHGENPFEEHLNLHVVMGDIHNAKDVESAILGCDAVLSALGSWGTKTQDILSTAMRSVIPAMENNNIKRVVSLTGADARDKNDRPNILQVFMHGVFGTIGGNVLKDGEEHIRILRSSSLDWTVLRSPVMTDSGKHGNFSLRLTLPYPWQTIHRTDVCTALCNLVESSEFVQQSPIIYR